MTPVLSMLGWPDTYCSAAADNRPAVGDSHPAAAEGSRLAASCRDQADQTAAAAAAANIKIRKKEIKKEKKEKKKEKEK